MNKLYVVTIDQEFEELQKSRVKAHPSKTKTGKLTMVKEYSRAGEKAPLVEKLPRLQTTGEVEALLSKLDRDEKSLLLKIEDLKTKGIWSKDGGARWRKQQVDKDFSKVESIRRQRVKIKLQYNVLSTLVSRIAQRYKEGGSTSIRGFHLGGKSGIEIYIENNPDSISFEWIPGGWTTKTEVYAAKHNEFILKFKPLLDAMGFNYNDEKNRLVVTGVTLPEGGIREEKVSLVKDVDGKRTIAGIKVGDRVGSKEHELLLGTVKSISPEGKITLVWEGDQSSKDRVVDSWAVIKRKADFVPKRVIQWISTAIDSPYAIQVPGDLELSFLKKYRPLEPIKLYRGLNFGSEERWLDFLKATDLKVGEEFEFEPNKHKTYVSSWSHNENAPRGFATQRPSKNVTQGTLQWLQTGASGKQMDGNHGIIVEAIINPDDMVVDMNMFPKAVSTKTYAVADEVFVKPDVKVMAKIVKLYSDKKGEIKDLAGHLKEQKKIKKSLLYVVTIDQEFEELQKSRVKSHSSKTKTGKLTIVKEYNRAGEKKNDDPPGWQETPRGRLIYKANLEEETEKENYVYAKITNAPSYPSLLKAYQRFIKKLQGFRSIKKEEQKQPWNLLTVHASVYNSKSSTAKTLRNLAHNIFKETGLPRNPPGQFRGEDGLDWDKVNVPKL